MTRPVVASIDLLALRQNLQIVRRAAPASRLWAVVKANAYGHGLSRVWSALSGADGFAMLNLEEAILLREHGWKGPILMLEGFFHADELALFEAGDWKGVQDAVRERLPAYNDSAKETARTLADDLRAALDDATDLAETWDDITPMARWEWVRWVNATRNADTRERRIEVSLSKMRAGKRRPCCFNLSSCTDPELSKNGKLLGIE